MKLNIFEGNYKPLLVLPIILYVVFLLLILVYPKVPFGMDMTGGTRIIVRTDKPIDSGLLEKQLKANYSLEELRITSTSGFAGNGTIIEFSKQKEFDESSNLLAEARKALQAGNKDVALEKATQAINSVKAFTQVNEIPSDAKEAVDLASDTLVKAKEEFQKNLNQLIINEFKLQEEPRIQVREIGPVVGSTFWNNAIMVVLIAMVLIAIIVFVFFREIIPSLAIIAAAIFDILTALAFMALFGIPLSLSSIPSLLMLVGYSIDTDILLTTRLLKRTEGTARQRSFEAMKTGLTMTATTIVAVLSMILLSYFTQMVVIYQIATLLLFGLFGDVISTWFMNAPVLLWYVEGKKVAK
jgi:preprotein translocase subunit SecF